MSWSAKQYVVFEDERTRPVRDLLAAVPTTEAHSVIDVGCGPGNSTETLMARYPNATIRGIDSSPDMIEAARKRLPQVRFDLIDIENWEEPGGFDVMLSNAVLHWVPNHDIVFPKLVKKLALGGSLAIQMPDNFAEPAHLLMREIAAKGAWSYKLAAPSAFRMPMAGPDWYYRELQPLCTKVDVWRTTYNHPLAGGAKAIVEWFKGSGLRPWLAPLDADEQMAFLEQYETAMASAYPALPDGTALLPFPRLFVVARR